MVQWLSSTDEVYVGADGDNMGSRVAQMILRGDRKGAHALSQIILKGQKVVVEWLQKVFGAKPIISGGDDTLVVIKASKFDPAKIEIMRAVYHATTGSTISAGVGGTMEEASKSLVIAKNTGKNKSVFWDPKQQGKYDAIIADRCNDVVTKCRSDGANESVLSRLKHDARGVVRGIGDVVHAAKYGAERIVNAKRHAYWAKAAEAARANGRSDLAHHAGALSRLAGNNQRRSERKDKQRTLRKVLRNHLDTFKLPKAGVHSRHYKPDIVRPATIHTIATGKTKPRGRHPDSAYNRLRRRLRRKGYPID